MAEVLNFRKGRGVKLLLSGTIVSFRRTEHCCVRIFRDVVTEHGPIFSILGHGFDDVSRPLECYTATSREWGLKNGWKIISSDLMQFGFYFLR